MRYLNFDIRNFKGIEHVYLDLSKTPRSRVHTLIGLNESGKTTILEAIDRFAYRESLEVLSGPGYTRQDIHEIIPIAKRANFNDSISIRATVGLGPEDKRQIVEKLRDHSIVLTSGLPDSFQITQTHEFSSSRLVKDAPMSWSLQVWGRSPTVKRSALLSSGDWQALATVTKSFLPRVMYFPNFLFEFPDKIYLENAPADQQKHLFFKAVLQDVLDAIGDNTNIQQHILVRAHSPKEFEKKILDSILLKMGGHITKTVFGAWDKIFRQPAGSKEIIVSIGKDSFYHKDVRRRKETIAKKDAGPTEDAGPSKPDAPKRDTPPKDAYFLKLRLKEGNTYYEISERSLGFRWFFTYLLLTQYRGFRTEGPRNVIFLLDEPASNLHPSAQAQLLNSFQSLPEGCDIIYTTHSHHLIKPEWLESAFVVKNLGLDYTKEIEQYTSRRTEITVQPYRQFASEHPNQTTYFQPVLDVLDYAPTRLELVPDVVMVEGKNDFFALRYMRDRRPELSHLHLVPGSGAGSLDTVIRLYAAWGRNFVILLDADIEGVAQRERYFDLFGNLVKERIFTLGDLSQAWKRRGMERMFTAEDQLAIQHAAFPDTQNFHKTHFARALQELVITRRQITLSGTTEADFAALFSALEAKLAAGKAADSATQAGSTAAKSK
jgi:ABC-type Mn2+/Zn2+ transport system ATPase subunit